MTRQSKVEFMLSGWHSSSVEFNPFAKKFRKGMRRIALVYPNRYVGGIANIGMQYIYAAVNAMDGYICERFYSDVFGGLRSVETGTPLEHFDVALFSLQYETDYFKAVEILRKSGFKGIRIAGGPCVMENPKPLLKYFDAFFIGECEETIEEIVAAKSVEELAALPGIYTGREDRVRRVYSKLSKHMEREIIGDGAYGRCFLVEIGRGCVRRCRFCIVRQMYFPPRWRKVEDLPEVGGVDKVAIIAPSPTDHPRFREILQMYVDAGLQVSPSSIRADTLDEELVELLKLAGVRTLTLAPETASQRLLGVANKGIAPEDVLNAAELAAGKFEKVKLYYIVGFPGESLDDIARIIEQVAEVKRRVRRVEVSVNPLVPKPHTPMQWLPFGGDADIKRGLKELRKKLGFIERECRKLGVETDIGKLREFEIQTILSRGDESVAAMLEGASPKKFGRFLEEIPVDAELPWDFIDHGYSKDRLLREYEKLREILNSDHRSSD